MRVTRPGEPGFEEARQPWNTAVDQPVAAVAEPAGISDVVTLVRNAHAARLGIATQAGGHGATGRTEGAILLRTHRLDDLTIDPAERRETT
jgi:FAD/FMN-containing dehydrogenase